MWNEAQKKDDLLAALSSCEPVEETMQHKAPREQTGEKADTEKRTDEELSIEEAFEKIRVLLQEMEKEDVPLEKAFADYEEGMKLIRICNERIDRVEKKVQMLNADGTMQDFA